MVAERAGVTKPIAYEHPTSTTFAVLNESGRRLGTHVVETNGQAFDPTKHRKPSG
ncbi:hypothetical protein [Sorangium sp. So ce1078]|uniref:hypothetical protein n=1 Tax=Sorangium sp. So ce1078 TaxID=3133329 RepID=UPI003F634DFC